MKICMMAHSIYETDARVRRTIATFTQRGDTVDFICLRNRAQPVRENNGLLSIYRPVRLRKPGQLAWYMLQLSWFFIACTWITTLRHLGKRYDIVYVHTIPDLLVFAGFIAKLFGAKIILDMHEIMPELYMNRYHIERSTWMLRLIIWAEKISVRFADLIFVAAPFLVNKLQQRHQCGDKITVTLNLPDPCYFALPPGLRQRSPEIFNLIYPGTLSELHGVDVALQAMKLLKEQTDWPIVLHIYGDGPEKEKLMRFADQADLRNVRFHEAVSIEELGKLLLRMDLGIVSKRSGVFAEDAVSTKLLEFAAAGLPAVASRTRGDMIFFNDSMFLFVEPGNARILAEGIKTMYQFQGFYHAMAASLRNWSRDNHWQKQQRLFHSRIEELMAGHDIDELVPEKARYSPAALAGAAKPITD